MKRTVWNASLIVCIACAVLGQQPAAAPKFEVASVKRTDVGGPPGDIPRNLDTSPGHFAMHNAPLRHPLLWAYDLKDYQVAGPDWIKVDERYDIIAKASGPAPEAEIRLMLRTLLTERFQLKLHWEKKDMSVYVLVPGKGAPNVKQSTGDGQPTMGGKGTAVFFQNQPISRFTFMLTRRLDRPVLDQTGLKGLYDFSVDVSGLGFNGKEPEDPNAPSIFTTVQRDLNMKLEARKEPIDILVIDSANKVPTEN